MPLTSLPRIDPRVRPWRRLVFVATLAAVCWTCGKSATAPSAGGGGGGGGGGAGGGGGGAGGGGVGVLVGAGDIAICDPPGTVSAGTVATARLLDQLGGTVFTAGDNAYFHGSDAEFRDCYGPQWGRFKSRTKPTPGNHEYETAGASGYFGYFGDVAYGPDGLGYYSYTLGTWTIYVLNGDMGGGSYGPSSRQVQWLRSELTAHPTRCTLAMWHRPLFSSGPNGDNPDMKDFWNALYDNNVDVIVNGHDHLYEHFAPQTPNGIPDSARGIVQFTVGTGGATQYAPQRATPNSVTVFQAFGVAQFTLNDGSYDYRFINVDPTGPTDQGSGNCH